MIYFMQEMQSHKSKQAVFQIWVWYHKKELLVWVLYQMFSLDLINLTSISSAVKFNHEENIYIYIYTYTDQNYKRNILLLPTFFMSWTQRSNNFSMHTKVLFLSDIVYKSV